MLAVIPYPQIDPFLFRIGRVGLSWYSFFYLVAFVAAYFLVRHRYRKGALKLERSHDIGLLITYLFYGVILGARIFYVLFYNPHFYWEHPIEIPAIWHGGMSFHGGLVGGSLALWIFTRRHNASFLQIWDTLSLCVPIGLGLGRFGNFINGELFGRVTDVPWAMIFPKGGSLPRHPSQLYESVLEGPILFLIMWWVSRKKFKDGTVASVGILSYGAMRFFIEFVREPDPQLGKVLGPFSMGQILCFAMILFGTSCLFFLNRRSSQKN